MERGSDILALTDHDTMDGLAEVIQAGKQYGLHVILGVERSAREYPAFHIIGYGFNLGALSLTRLRHRMKVNRDEQTGQLFAFLKKGIALTAEEVGSLADGAIIGRPHFAQAMIRQGYVSTKREAFDCYLDTKEYHQKIERGKPSVQEYITAIKTSGDKVSLAHPYQIGIDNDELDKLVRALADQSLDAIECYYPKYTPEQQEFYLYLTEKYHLHRIGGSDFHGEKVKPDVELATLNLDIDWLLEN